MQIAQEQDTKGGSWHIGFALGAYKRKGRRNKGVLFICLKEHRKESEERIC